MAKKDRFHVGYSGSAGPRYGSEGSDSLGCTRDNPSGPKKKWVDLNSASSGGFAVPIQVIPLSKLSPSERRNVLLRLKSELEMVHLLQNKLQLQKKKPVKAEKNPSSSDIIGSRNIHHKELPVDLANESSSIGKKAQVLKRDSTGRFESVKQERRVDSFAGLLKQCESILKKLMTHQYAWVFNTPVDVVGLNIPDYLDVIKNPMDLGTIKKKLASGKYSSPSQFVIDVRLTFSNAMTYNPPGSDVHIMADTMSKFFESRFEVIEKKLLANGSKLVPQNSGIKESKIAKPMVPAKKRKFSPIVHEAIQEPTKRKMTDGEKQKISTELEDVLGDLPDSIIDFLKMQTSNGGNGEEDEIEIDIDDLSDDALFTLRKLLDDHLQEKRKKLAKSEACEIELPNVLELSNSSLQLEQGSGPIDDNVDVRGDEAPVNSHPPALIDKDSGRRAEECREAGLDSERGHRYSKGSIGTNSQDDVDQMDNLNNDQETDELIDRHRENAKMEGQVSPDKMYRAALLRNRFADTILRAREKTLTQDDKSDPEKLRREREELEMHKRKEKVRLEAEARAAEDARRQAEAKAAAEEKRRRELEREAAREALLKMEKTVEMNENSGFLEDLEILRGASAPSSAYESDPSPDRLQDGFGSFKFRGSNPLEQLGLYMKVEDDDEEDEENCDID